MAGSLGGDLRARAWQPTCSMAGQLDKLGVGLGRIKVLTLDVSCRHITLQGNGELVNTQHFPFVFFAITLWAGFCLFVSTAFAWISVWG